MVENAVATYMTSTYNQATIYNGKEQENYQHIRNHPFLKESNYTPGLLSYNGIIYNNVQLRLDQYRDELVVWSPDRRFNVVLASDKVDFAEIHQYHIIYLRPDSMLGNLHEGFYLLLHSGKYTVLEKRSSVVTEREGRATFVTLVKYYLYKDGAYHRVKNKKSVLNILGDHKRELNRFIRDSRLNFGKDAGHSIARVVKEYEKLSHEQ